MLQRLFRSVFAGATVFAMAMGVCAAEPTVDCVKVNKIGGSQRELNVCQSQKFAEADADLNKVYGELRKHFKETADTEAELLLVKAQRAWVTWRSAEAEVCAQTQGWSRGGSGYNMVVQSCETDLTRERTGVLRMHLREAESH